MSRAVLLFSASRAYAVLLAFFRRSYEPVKPCELSSFSKCSCVMRSSATRLLACATSSSEMRTLPYVPCSFGRAFFALTERRLIFFSRPSNHYVFFFWLQP